MTYMYTDDWSGPNYTERQKKHRFFASVTHMKSKESIWIIFEHRLGKFILNKHIAKNNSLLQS